MFTDKPMEMAQLLARFKLQVKRMLGETVDLERLMREPSYARQRLAEIEEAATEEDLLVMVLRIRDAVLPGKPQVEEALVMTTTIETPQKVKETRSYLMGARAW